MCINNRILLSNVAASLLLMSYPIIVSAVDLDGITYLGDANEVNSTPLMLDDTSNTLIPIEITDVVNSGITISNSATLTVDSDSNDVYGIYVDNGNDGTINHSGTIDLNSTSGSAYGVLVYDGSGVNSGTISNTGDIVAEAGSDVAGIYVYDNSGSITNSGSIDLNSTDSGNTTGIVVENENSGSVTNTSNITATANNNDATGIYAGANLADANITNSSSGVITATSANSSAYGINIGDTNAGNVNNLGEISTTATFGSAAGIYVNTNDGTINNEGSIVAEGRTDTYGIYADTNNGTISHSGTIETSTTDDGTAYGIYMVNNYGTVTADGSIYAHSLNGSTYGIYSDSDNGGVINANDSISSTSTDGDATGIYIGGNNQDLTNNGTIEAHSDNSRATGIEISNSNDGTVTNVNAITVDSITNDAYGLVVGSNTGTISNSGSIDSTSTDGNAYGIYLSGTNSGLITNSDTIIVNSTNNDAYGIYVNDNMGTITNSGTITAPIALSLGSSGTFENTSTGLISGDLQASMTNVQNDGTINLASTDASSVNDFTQSATGVLGIKLNSGSDGIATYSQLVANGTVTLNAGATLNVNVQTATDYQDLLVGQQLADVISASTLTADVSTLTITDTSALLNFTPIIDGTTLDLDIVQGTSILEATQNSGVVGAYGAASVLSAYTGNNDDLNNFIDSLNTFETEEEVAQAILETTPTTIAALPTMSTQLYGAMGSIVQSYQSGGSRGLNSGDIVFGDKTLWIKPFGSYSKQKNKKGLNGFSAHSKGFGIGMDGEYARDHRAGLAFFYTNTDASTNGVSQSTELDVFTLIGYGNIPILDNKTNFLYQVGAGIQQTDSSRYISAVPTTATADYNAKSFFTQLKVAREIPLNNALSLSNELYGSYVYYKNPSYTESGAGGLNLNVQSFTTTTFIVGIEENLKYAFDSDTDFIGNIALGYDFGNTNQSVSASYAGASGTIFDTKGIDNGHWSYKAGVGVAQILQENLSLDLKYDLEGKGVDFKNHTVSAKMNWKF
ncbi:MAG: hypothetical protein A2023_04500 [Sulfuricurvum sp. GWF2_44_89]|uniref:Autotransporter domain-containing protein n=1 Tax=Sulfuricurvum kujiense TaxID=148813 RepID=A0A2D3WKS9_9BACT|nr:MULTISPECIES: autotransporter outer membrane beta-barrel domain-containing protein [Sulfuricurvum]OHD78663.1 MAG: hypothetical protein A2023_04500 [Sulfuricurvum sp. GWF2_44_89]OHD92674.1 MAG: hypothetical protein A2517_04760 [Sulfuricurvum sp. RIFOXYD12_FULL_44_77]OHD95678.1 MAG: hypothetical protein A2552_03995 [Sulfuricurvum sp. RIFOXYD2_FULL_44_160]DAB38334.1 MAG TPA: hypothetical protein CFH83_06490 [Sulfuricurvum kujiense]